MTNQERELVNEAATATNAAWEALTTTDYRRGVKDMGATLGALLRALEVLSELMAIKPRKTPAKKENGL